MDGGGDADDVGLSQPEVNCRLMGGLTQLRVIEERTWKHLLGFI